MKIEKPEAARVDVEKKTVELYMPSSGPQEFYLRGGISFPGLGDEEVKGYALMLGYHVRERIAYVLEEVEWMTVDHIMDETGIRYRGLSPWFGMLWQTYFADSFFYNDKDETERKYLYQILRSPMIKPKPHMVEIKWNDDRTALHTVWEWGNTGRFRTLPGKLADDLAAYSSDAPEIPRSVWSLMCALNGLERYPYRKRNVG